MSSMAGRNLFGVRRICRSWSKNRSAPRAPGWNVPTRVWFAQLLAAPQGVFSTSVVDARAQCVVAGRNSSSAMPTSRALRSNAAHVLLGFFAQHIGVGLRARCCAGGPAVAAAATRRRFNGRDTIAGGPGSGGRAAGSGAACRAGGAGGGPGGAAGGAAGAAWRRARRRGGRPASAG